MKAKTLMRKSLQGSQNLTLKTPGVILRLLLIF